MAFGHGGMRTRPLQNADKRYYVGMNLSISRSRISPTFRRHYVFMYSIETLGIESFQFTYLRGWVGGLFAKLGCSRAADTGAVRIFEIFKYLSLVHHAVFGDYNSDYSRPKCDKLLPFRVTVVTESGDKLSV